MAFRFFPNLPMNFLCDLMNFQNLAIFISYLSPLSTISMPRNRIRSRFTKGYLELFYYYYSSIHHRYFVRFRWILKCHFYYY
jgi:hypothetical protein